MIDAATHTTVAQVAVSPDAVAVHPDGTRIYTTRVSGSTTAVLVLDPATLAVIATIPVAASPIDIEVSRDGSTAYVVCSNGEALCVIDTATNTVTSVIPIKGSPVGVAVNPTGSRVYVVNAHFGIDALLVLSESLIGEIDKELMADLFGAVSVGGGGWVVIGKHFYPVPPRPLEITAFARAVAPLLGQPIENPELAEQFRVLANRDT